MHRETLSRSLFLSHNIMGKSISALASSKGIVTCAKPPLTMLLRSSHVEGQQYQNHHRQSSRCFHTSLERPAQSVTKTILAETRQSKTEDSDGFERIGKVKQFNLKAKDILDVPEERSVSSTAVDSTSVSTRSLLETRIFAARSIEELLNLSSEPEMTLKHACLIISRLGNFAQLKPNSPVLKSIQQDKRFVRVFNLIQRGNHSQFPHTLLQALNGLQKLGMETTDEVTRLLENELSWSMRRCPLKFLAKSVRILHNNAPKSAESSDVKEKHVLQAAVQVLHRRWIEAITGSEFISIFQIIELLDDETKLKVEERAADIAHQFTPHEMMKIFIVLGSKKRRPTPLLRALAFHYSKAECTKGPAKDVIEFIYALNELTFADPILMNRLCTDLSEDISNIKNVALISSLLTSLGQMRYKNKQILLAVDDWITKNLNELRPFDYAAWLQAAATLNHTSENILMFCSKAEKVLTQSSASSPTEWVNITHAFVVLNHCNSDMLSSVLNPTFADSIDRLGLKSSRQKVKLLNLNYIASQRKGKDYDGPLLPQEKVQEWALAHVNCSDAKLCKLVTDSLATFLPLNKYLELNRQLESGVFIDAVICVDNKMKPMTLEAAKSTPSQKVAIVVEGYPALSLGLKESTGHSMLNIKILESQNFIVITVPYTEFGYTEKLVRRVQYLEQKLKSISTVAEGALPVNTV